MNKAIREQQQAYSEAGGAYSKEAAKEVEKQAAANVKLAKELQANAWKIHEDSQKAAETQTSKLEKYNKKAVAPDADLAKEGENYMKGQERDYKKWMKQARKDAR